MRRSFLRTDYPSGAVTNLVFLRLFNDAHVCARRPSFFGKMLVGSLENPKPQSASKAGRPGSPRPGVVEHFLTRDAEYLAAMDGAASLDWRALRFPPPIAPWLPLRFNLGDAFRGHAVHVRRHIGQIERVIAAV